jgi:hypothetical protein
VICAILAVYVRTGKASATALFAGVPMRMDEVISYYEKIWRDEPV